ncbi:hypothetical protein MTR_4g036095 [Medicago truncatula]|uniref:Uncharacterized protein n=1 Tax=Medicago truncatula TaxID=3880 RepID=A0A072UU62_MEDTR|nr:hypothetical protein MTR_4g036095 [Medicago truncatula]
MTHATSTHHHENIVSFKVDPTFDVGPSYWPFKTTHTVTDDYNSFSESTNTLSHVVPTQRKRFRNL